MNNKVWQKLLKSALETEEIEISCEECFELLDNYADLIVEGTDAEALMPEVKQHLKQCNCCVSELEALMIMLQEIADQGKQISSEAN